MNIVLIGIVIFLLTIAAGYAGLQVQARLSPRSTRRESRRASSVKWRGWSACCWRWFWER